RIVIEPPAGTDVRAAVALSPIYLESLRTYEQFASGDSLFQRATAKFGLSGGPIEARKGRGLKVGLLRNTPILQISAKLPDARTSQALAQFIAEATVEMNRSLEAEGDRDLVGGILQQQEELRKALQELNGEWARLLDAEPVEVLQAEAKNAAALRATLDEQVSNTDLEISDLADREKNAESAE